jgi:hypothetical protein
MQQIPEQPALWRSPSVPRSLPVTLAVLTVAQFAIPASRMLDVVQAAFIATFIAIAWFLRDATAQSR